MGNDPGKPLNNDEDSKVVLELKGPLSPEDAKHFKEELQKLLDAYKGTGYMKVAIKK
jgi:hypothetical protein